MQPRRQVKKKRCLEWLRVGSATALNTLLFKNIGFRVVKSGARSTSRNTFAAEEIDDNDDDDE